ncbi:MAG: glycosyltransferase [Bacillota bacterium]
MKKVVQFISSLHMGGAEIIVKDYVSLLNKDIIDSRVLLMQSFDCVNEEEVRKQGIPIDSLIKTKASKFIIKKLINFTRRHIEFIKYFKKEKIDVLHIHLPIVSYVFFHKKLFKNVKLYHTVHADLKYMFKKNTQRKFEKYCVKRLIKSHNLQLIALHDDMRIQLNEMFNVNNTLVLNNGINLERFKKELYVDSREDILKDIGFNEDDFIVGHVGRLNIAKNHKFLIEVFVELLNYKSNAKLLLVGAGELKQEIMELLDYYHIIDKVVILGNRTDVPDLMSVMNVFLFPSSYEGLGIAVIEAQSLGLRCVVSKAVPEAAHVTEQYVSLSLDENKSIWCKALLGNNICSIPKMSIEDYDMRKIVYKLANLYLI